MSVTSSRPTTSVSKTALPWYKRESSLRILRTVLTLLVIIPLALLFLAPYIGMFSTALKTPKQIFAYPPKIIPDPIMWSNFPDGWSKYVDFNTYLFNSLKITLNAVIGNLISCTLAAYAFARLKARGKNILFGLVLATMLLPTEVLLVPQFILFTKLGMNNTHWPLLLPPWFGWPFFIFLLRQFFMTLPKELDEAAIIDGANWFQVLWYIVLPLSVPALTTVAIFSFVGNWNNYLGPLVYLRDQELLTLPLGIAQFQGQFGNTAYHFMMSNAVLILIPVLVIFFLAQRLFIEGIALTGNK